MLIRNSKFPLSKKLLRRGEELERHLRRVLRVDPRMDVQIYLWSTRDVRIAEISVSDFDERLFTGVGASWMQVNPEAGELLFACERYLVEPCTDEDELDDLLFRITCAAERGGLNDPTLQ